MSDQLPYDLTTNLYDYDTSKKNLEFGKGNGLIHIVDMSIEIEKERRKAQSAMIARDATVERLVDAYKLLREKTTLLEKLQNQSPQQQVLANKENIFPEVIIEENQQERKARDKENEPVSKDLTERDGLSSRSYLAAPVNPFIYHRTTPPILSRASSEASVTSVSSTSSGKTIFQIDDSDLDFTIVRSSPSGEAEDSIEARHKLLASIPLPEDIPEDALKPFVMPSPYSLPEFLGLLRNSVSDYRTLNELTTSWCPRREEHGYFLTPASSISPLAPATTDTPLQECFYNKNGTWYYAGVYQAFRMDDLTPKEWEALSNETTQALIKDTLAGRKNISPQNVYETAQLYAAGALKVACIGLQCVGFNRMLYHAIQDQVAKLSQRKQGGYSSGSDRHGRTGSDVVDGLAGLLISGRRDEGGVDDTAR
ncbi:hypothetical protein VNI00_009737 [Paramarasmius palmivorus]|uniref:DUF6697 domain-containing protein n=1 Tax=Paramarasmius palmivorus TaxID=297713 RepID=A0AAW0CN80_9AGAR